jgi:hypothetical protein
MEDSLTGEKARDATNTFDSCLVVEFDAAIYCRSVDTIATTFHIWEPLSKTYMGAGNVMLLVIHIIRYTI